MRLGMTPGSAGWIAQRPVVQDMLITSVDMLDDAFRDRLRFVPNRLLTPLALGEYDLLETVTAYKVPDDCEPHYIENLSTLWSGVWHTVPKGITDSMRNCAYAFSGTYDAWDIIECGEIELWPHSGEALSCRISYTRKPIDYTDESECIDMDRQLLILLTLDTAIPYYNRPDADATNRHLNRHMMAIKAKQLRGLKYNKRQRGRVGGTPDAADRLYAYPVRP